MKLEAIIRRVSLARDSKMKSIMPYDNFYDKIMAAVDLVDFTEDQKAETVLRQEARKYFIITCLSAMETYFKRNAQAFIEARLINEDLYEILRQDKISLADLLEINKRELSIGEIVSVSHSFQDIESIERFYSKMFGVASFTKECETIEVENETGERFTLGYDHPDFRKKIIDLVRLRHLIVHHEGYKGVLGLERTTNMGRIVMAFVSAADEYIISRIPDD